MPVNSQRVFLITIGLARTPLLLALLLWSSFIFAQSREFPELTGRVVDTAGLLPSTAESELTTKLAAHESSTGQQVVVVTIPSLKGGEIDGYANRLFRHWGLGDKERNDGVLFVVAKNDRKLRIEVGYGLEGILTDALSGYIIRTAIVPAFKKGQFDRGIIRGADQILEVLSSDEAELEAWRGKAKKRTKSSKGPDWPVLIFFGIWVFIIIGIPLLNAMIFKYGTKLGPDHYRWLGMEARRSKRVSGYSTGWGSGSSSGGGWSGGGGWSSGGGGFGGGGGSSGGGGASGGW